MRSNFKKELLRMILLYKIKTERSKAADWGVVMKEVLWSLISNYLKNICDGEKFLYKNLFAKIFLHRRFLKVIWYQISKNLFHKNTSNGCFWFLQKGACQEVTQAAIACWKSAKKMFKWLLKSWKAVIRNIFLVNC